MAETPEQENDPLDPRLVKYLREHCGPHAYGEQNADGIDLSLIRANLKLSPTERVRRAEQLADEIRRLHELGRRHRRE